MPKGKGGPRRKKGGFGGNRELLLKDDNEEYAHVLKLLGGERMEVHCMDGVKRIAKVRGKFKKRVWVHINDIVLVSLREQDEDKCDIIHVYYADEAKQLKQLGEIPSQLEINENANSQTQRLEIVFDDENEEKGKEKDKEKSKAPKQDLNKFMPSSDSEDHYEEEVKAKPNAKDNVAKQKETVAKQDQNKKTAKKVSDSEDSSESEKEFDPLADI